MGKLREACVWPDGGVVDRNLDIYTTPKRPALIMFDDEHKKIIRVSNIPPGSPYAHSYSMINYPESHHID